MNHVCFSFIRRLPFASGRLKIYCDNMDPPTDPSSSKCLFLSKGNIISSQRSVSDLSDGRPDKFDDFY